MPVSGLHVVLLDHVRDNFGVCFGCKLMPLFGELLLQSEVVLDDPVMHHYNAAGAIAMRMSVLFGGTAVGGPAGMADAISPVERLKADYFFKIAQFAFGAANLQAFTVAANGNTGRVIAAV